MTAMTDDFLIDDASIEDSQPRDLYEIVQSALVTYRITSGERDIVYDGNTYTAEPVARTAVGISATTGEFTVSLVLPLNHGLPQRYMSQGSPPQRVEVVIRHLELRSGIAEVTWHGFATSMASDFKDHTAKFLIPSRMSRSLNRRCPSLTVGPTCSHVLYDRNCRVDPTSFTVATTVVSFDGRTIVVDASSAPILGDNEYLPFGDFTHDRSKEIQTIWDQSGIDFLGRVTLTLQSPIPEIAVGDTVTLRAGCAHDIGTCYAKFANMGNYSSMPVLPKTNLFIPGNLVGIFGR